MSGLFGGGGATISTVDPVAAGLRIQTSAYGMALPLVYGRTRIPGNLMWYGDFTPIAHTETTSSGGGGKGGGGEVTSSHTTYTYTAAFALGLGEGPFTAIHAFWRDKDFITDASSVFTLKLGTYPQAVWSHLSSNHAAEAVPYQGVAYVCASAYDLGSSDYLQNHSFEVTARLPHQVGVIDDANPKDILADLLANANYGVSFPAGKLGDWTQFSAYCVANGLFFSPCYSDQQQASEVVTKLTALANTAPYFSEGLLKCTPLGDVQITGNAVTFTPNVTPLYDLTDDDYLDQDEPVRVIRNASADAYNQVQVEYVNRQNQYNVEIAEAKDQTAIDTYGLLTAEPIAAHEIARTEVARAVAQIKLQRALFIRNEYEFRLGWKYALVEPTDILTLTDASLGMDKVPVRVLTVEESEDGGFLMTAEDFPAGTTSAATYASQDGGGYTLNTYITPGPVNTPAIFEPPNGLTAPDLEVWVAVSGTVPEWGGCDVWVSEDNATFRNIGRVVNPARHGTLSSALATGSDPDITNTLAVNLSLCRGALVSVSQADADDGNSLLWVDGELISYQNATLTTQYHYNLTYLRRGRNGTAIGAHASGTQFARLDDAIFKYVVPRDLIGRPIWLKFTSFNIFGNATQQLADVVAYSYTILGNRPAGLASLSGIGGMFLNQIGWSFAQNQYDRDFIEIWGGTTNNRAVATLLTSQKDPTTSWKHPGLPAAQQWFYWGRVVDTSGNQSDFFPTSPTNGVPATTSSDVAEMLAFLQGKIGDSALTTELLTSITGSGGNLLQNSGFDVDISGWGALWKQVPGDPTPTIQRNLAGAPWTPTGMNTIGMVRAGMPTGVQDFGLELVRCPAIEPGARYCVSSWLAAHRCPVDIAILFLDSVMAYIAGAEAHSATTTASGGESLSGWVRRSIFVTAPANARYAYVFARAYAATGADPYAWMCRPMLERAVASQTVPSAWSQSAEGITAAVKTTETTVAGLSAQYTIKVDVNGKVTGIGLASSPSSSEIVMLADKLTFVQPDGSGTPQQVLTVGTINGQPALGFAGHLLAADGSFSGQLLAATGTFTGALNAASGTFAGALSGATGTFSGALNAATGTFAGSLAAGVLNAAAFDSISYEYATAGTFNLTIPAMNADWSAMKMKVSVQAAGGGGGGGSYGGGGGGGGGGAGQRVTYDGIACTPGQVVGIVIGLGGNPGANGIYSAATSGTVGALTQVTYVSVTYGATAGTGGGSGWWAGQPVYALGGTIGGQNGLGTLGGGKGGDSTLAGGGAGAVGTANAGSGLLGSGGGGACYSDEGNTAAAAGGRGHVLIEFYDPNLLVLNSRYSNLITWLDTTGHGAVPANAR